MRVDLRRDQVNLTIRFKKCCGTVGRWTQILDLKTGVVYGTYLSRGDLHRSNATATSVDTMPANTSITSPVGPAQIGSFGGLLGGGGGGGGGSGLGGVALGALTGGIGGAAGGGFTQGLIGGSPTNTLPVGGTAPSPIAAQFGFGFA